LRKALKITAIVLGVPVVLLAIVFAIFPIPFIDTIRNFPYYNPFERVVTNDDPKPLGPLTESAIVEVYLRITDKELRRVLIYLPKGYGFGNKDYLYPTLYLLHGTPGTEEDWLRLGKARKTLDEAIANHTIPPVIAVFPNGNGGIWDDTEYINSADGRQPNEDFIVDGVVPYIDQNYATRADSKYRAIGGLSEGGFAALNLALKHQDVFGYAMSLSGYGNIDQNDHSAKVIQGSAQVIHDNSPIQYIPDLETHTTKILIITGQEDTEDNLLGENQELNKLLKEKGFSVDFQLYEGKHAWIFWITHLRDAMEWWGKELPHTEGKAA